MSTQPDPVTKFCVRRIPVPEWARPFDVRFHSFRLRQYQVIQERREQMLEVVRAEVEAYLNEPGLTYENDPEGFPNLGQMTGEYYVGSELYCQHVGPPWIQIGVECRFLEKPWLEGQTEFDYLGLQVWLRHDPNDGTFTVYRNTDSSVI